MLPVARATLTIITCLFFFQVLAQRPPAAGNPAGNYYGIPGLVAIDSISWPALQEGFSCRKGFWGYRFELDTVLRFRKMEYGCSGIGLVDSGAWKIEKNNRLVLRSPEATLNFYIFTFDRFRFFVLASQRRKFIGDLRSAWEKCRLRKPIELDGEYYSPAFMAGSLLSEKYYCYY